MSYADYCCLDREVKLTDADREAILSVLDPENDHHVDIGVKLAYNDKWRGIFECAYRASLKFR